MIVVISILIVVMLLLGAAIAVLSVIVTIDSFRGDRSKSLTDPAPTHAETMTRRILGIGVCREHEGIDENA
jgi:hypothetical protein